MILSGIWILFQLSKLDVDEDMETISYLKGLTDGTIIKLKVKEANELI